MSDDMYARQIAARGITPNHRGKQIDAGFISGTLVAYDHFERLTVLVIRTELAGLVEVDLEHLEEVTVYD